MHAKPTDYDKTDAIGGCLVGTAVGDALGLPYEGLSRPRRERMFGPVRGHRFVFGRGMVSDDTEHACMAAQSLVESGDDAGRFARTFARRLRWWLVMIPAGIGFATLRACLKLWAGFSPARSGVYSAGNGPAMRSPVLGAALGSERNRLRAFVEASTLVTHRDRKAFCGAYAAALAAAWAAEDRDRAAFVDSVADHLQDEPEAAVLIDRIRAAERSAADSESTSAFAESIGLSKGVSGYIYDTIPIAVHGWMRHPGDFERAVAGVIECGGDTDTTGAIAGAIVGAGVGVANVPAQLVRRILEWPRTVDWMLCLSEALARSRSNPVPAKAPRLNPLFVLVRNVVFTVIVLLHGFRRIAPPY